MGHHDRNRTDFCWVDSRVTPDLSCSRLAVATNGVTDALAPVLLHRLGVSKEVYEPLRNSRKGMAQIA
jgi:hypothetical protein